MIPVKAYPCVRINKPDISIRRYVRSICSRKTVFQNINYNYNITAKYYKYKFSLYVYLVPFSIVYFQIRMNGEYILYLHILCYAKKHKQVSVKYSTQWWLIWVA